MTILESVNEKIFIHDVASVKKPPLYLAYLMMCMENPGLHPDDHLSDEGGYVGSQVILCEEALTRSSKPVPDNFEYPVSFLKIDDVLTELLSFHEDLVNDSAEDNDHETMLVGCVNTAMSFFENMHPTELLEAIECLQSLYLYHANENDTEEEEGEKPAGVLKECADVLNWVLMQH